MIYLYETKPLGNGTLLDYDMEYDDFKYESVQTKYCKYSLNVSKYASNYACRAELGRYPIAIKVLSMCVKYWLRAEQGTNNFIFNNAYQTAKSENHPFVQGVQRVMTLNGFGDVFMDPAVARGEVFAKVFERTLQDQYIQTWQRKARNSETLGTLYE